MVRYLINFLPDFAQKHPNQIRGKLAVFSKFTKKCCKCFQVG